MARGARARPGEAHRVDVGRQVEFRLDEDEAHVVPEAPLVEIGVDGDVDNWSLLVG